MPSIENSGDTVVSTDGDAENVSPALTTVCDGEAVTDGDSVDVTALEGDLERCADTDAD